jgi:hypothetical protein
MAAKIVPTTSKVVATAVVKVASATSKVVATATEVSRISQGSGSLVRFGI